jgi:hypothetical protein
LEVLQREHPNQRIKSETHDYFPHRSKMGDGKYNVLLYTVTDGKTRNIVQNEAL